MFPGVSRNNKSQWAPKLLYPGPACHLLYFIPYLPGAWRELALVKNCSGTSRPWTRALEGVIAKQRGEGILFPPKLLMLDCVSAKSLLMEMYVPQLVRIICKSIFLPLESTGGYQRVSFSTLKFLTDFIMQRLCFCSIVLCTRLWIQKFKDQKSFFWFGLLIVFVLFFFKSMQSFWK